MREVGNTAESEFLGLGLSTTGEHARGTEAISRQSEEQLTAHGPGLKCSEEDLRKLEPGMGCRLSRSVLVCFFVFPGLMSLFFCGRQEG